MNVRNPKLRRGHAPGHVRDTFCDAVDAFLGWQDGEPEPCVEFEIHYVAHAIVISRACTLVWNCTDIVPGMLIAELRDHGLEIKRATYAACARAMHAEIRAQIEADSVAVNCGNSFPHGCTLPVERYLDPQEETAEEC